MKDLVLIGDKNRPSVNGLVSKETLTFSGRSLLEDPEEFYSLVSSWISKYMLIYNRLIVIFDFNYLNSGSSKKILDIIILINDLTINQSKDISIIWKYKSGDEDGKETGEQFRDFSTVNYNLDIVYDDC